MPKMAGPTEAEEMAVVAEYLNFKGILWLHPASEGKRSWAHAKALKRCGLLTPGYPDIVIMERPIAPGHEDFLGVCVELKRAYPRGKIRPEQQEFLRRAVIAGWLTHVAYGAADALQFLGRVGF